MKGDARASAPIDLVTGEGNGEERDGDQEQIDGEERNREERSTHRNRQMDRRTLRLHISVISRRVLTLSVTIQTHESAVQEKKKTTGHSNNF